MQSTVGTTAKNVITSTNGDVNRPSKILFTVVGDGTIYIEHNTTASASTSVPMVEGQYADADLYAGDIISMVSDGSVDVRIFASGAKVDIL
jgi:hypothetical protein